MQALVNELVEKVGLSEEKAQQTVTTTMNFIKAKLPPALSGQFENLVSGDLDLNSLFGGPDNSENKDNNPLDALKGMFGK